MNEAAELSFGTPKASTDNTRPRRDNVCLHSFSTPQQLVPPGFDTTAEPPSWSMRDRQLLSFSTRQHLASDANTIAVPSLWSSTSKHHLHSFSTPQHLVPTAFDNTTVPLLWSTRNYKQIDWDIWDPNNSLIGTAPRIPTSRALDRTSFSDTTFPTSPPMLLCRTYFQNYDNLLPCSGQLFLTGTKMENDGELQSETGTILSTPKIPTGNKGPSMPLLNALSDASPTRLAMRRTSSDPPFSFD